MGCFGGSWLSNGCHEATGPWSALHLEAIFYFHVDFSEGRYQQQDLCWISQVKILQILRILSICWCVGKLFYLRCLLAWNYCCCTSELWIYTTVCWLHYYFISVEFILKVANPCIHWGCKFVRLIFRMILFAAVEIVGFILLSSNACLQTPHPLFPLFIWSVNRNCYHFNLLSAFS